MILTPRIALAVCSIVSLAAGGGVVASHFGAFPPREVVAFPPREVVVNRASCELVVRVPGQVKLYDRNNLWIETYDKVNEDAFSRRTASNRGVVADLYCDGHRYHLEGIGRQTVRDDQGRVIGYVEMTRYYPATKVAERITGTASTSKQSGSTVQITGTDGWYRAQGVLTDGNRYHGWKLIGVGIVRFRREDNGKELFRAVAHSLDTRSNQQRADVEREMQQTEKEARATFTRKHHSTFTVKLNDVSHTLVGYGTKRIVLPGGTHLLIDRLPPGKL